jgi:hypothetical protein
MLTAGRFEVEGDTSVLLDAEGNAIGEPYSLSPLQDPREVAAWLWGLRLNEGVETV